MKRTWLAIDVNYLAYRAMHTTGELSANGIATGTMLGILKTVFELRDQFRSNNVLWCFDHGKNRRNKIYPAYKQSTARLKNREDNKEAIEKMKAQLEVLKEELPKIRCRNVLMCKGYEADDCIAKAIHQLREDIATANDPVIIVSADKDMYQCLSPNTSVYDPRQSFEMTFKLFSVKNQIKTKQWAIVKAIAGCATDNIKGIKGVGEKTAIKYLNGSLVEGSKQYNQIKDWIGTKGYKLNKELIKLPMEGIKDLDISLKPDPFQEDDEWKPLFKKFKFKRLQNGY